MRLGDTASVDNPTQPTATVGFSSFLDNLVKAATAYLTYDQQKQLMQINTQRAAQGLAPLSIDQYAAGVNVGLTNSTQNTLLWIAGGLGAVFLVSSLMKGKRR